MLKTNFNRATECSKNNTTPDNHIPVATQGSKVMIYQICQQVKEARIFNGVTPTSSRHVIIFHVRALFPSALCAEKPACSCRFGAGALSLLNTMMWWQSVTTPRRQWVSLALWVPPELQGGFETKYSIWVREGSSNQKNRKA